MLTLQRELSRFLGGGRRRRAPRQPDLHAKARRQFKRLAEQHGFTFEKSRDGYLETSPFGPFPDGFTTLHYDWTETLERLRYCLANPDAVDAEGYYSE